MGSLDTRLLQHLIDVVARTGYRTIVSMGPCHDEVRLGPAMYGEPFLPQPNVLAEQDLRRRLTATAESIRHDPGALVGGERIADLGSLPRAAPPYRPWSVRSGGMVRTGG